jgi:cytoskeletal protein CcmA (bactofilin family)
MTFAGKLTGGGIKGPILTVSHGASITGNVESDTCILHGTVKGDVFVTGKCDLGASAILLGDLTTSRLVMGEGATFVGKADIRPERKILPVPATKTE